MKKLLNTSGILAAAMLTASSAQASLIGFETYTGSVGVSTDGAVSTGSVSTISAGMPSGATVLAAYLYTATQNFSNGNEDFSFVPPPGVQLNGNEISYDATFFNDGIAAARPEIRLSSHRADVTGIVAAAYDGNAGTVDFDYAETFGATNIDGSALVVVYDDPTLSDRTIAILNGASSSTGDTAVANFASALDPTAPGFSAEMFLGINFSTGSGSQVSDVTVNGTLLSDEAGGFDDGALADGQLLTVGSFDDPFAVFGDDTERYDLSSFISAGDTSLTIDTFNPSNDDNIFLAVLDLTGEARVTTTPVVPLPASAFFMLGAFGMLGASRRFKKAS